MEPLAKAEAEVKAVCDGYIVQIKADIDKGTFGVVLVRRPHPNHPYVTWYWAVADTSGNPVMSRTGAMLWSGHYFTTYEEAVEDFNGRRNPS